MDNKPKAGGTPRKAKEQKIEDKEQSERFIATARDINVEEDQESFVSFFKKMKQKAQVK